MATRRTTSNKRERERSKQAKATAKRERRQDKSPDEEGEVDRVRRELRDDRRVDRAHCRDARAVRRRSDHLRSVRRGEVGADGAAHRAAVGIVCARHLSYRAPPVRSSVNQPLAGLGVRTDDPVLASQPARLRARPGRQAQRRLVADVLRVAPPAVPRVLHRRVTRTAVILAVVTFTTRMFCITAGLPPLLLAQVVPAEPVLAVRARVRRNDGVAKGTVVVGRASPQPSPLLRHRTRRALAQARAFGGATSAGSCATSTTRPTSARSATSRSIPRSGSSTSTTGSGRGRSR